MNANTAAHPDPSAAASEVLAYVCCNGEPPTDAPVTLDTRDALARYDGTSASEDRIWSAYKSAFRGW